MPFILTNGNAFVGTDSNNRRVTVSSPSTATRFVTKEKASLALANLPHSFKNVGFHISEIADTSKPATEPQFQPIEHGEQNEPKSVTNMKSAIAETLKLMGNVRSNYDAYILELKKTEGQITDIEHKIEFTNANASQGYQLFKLLQETRQKRREYKDLLLMCDFVLHASFSDWTTGKPKLLLNELGDRKYRPRQMPDLFQKTE